MSASITASFTQQWDDEVKLAFQQKTSKLLDQVRVRRDVVGSTYNFHKLGVAAASTKSRGALITPAGPTHSIVTATLVDTYAGDYIDTLDELKTNASFRQEYVNSFASALARKVDAQIIAALNTATTTTATTTGGLTFAKLLEALTYMNKNNVDSNDRVIAISAQQMSDALAISQLTSTDYVQVQAILQAGVGTALGFNWVVIGDSTDVSLPKVTTNRTCFAFNKQAIGVAIGQDIKTEINYIPDRMSNFIGASVSAGAILIEDAGVVKLNCVE